MEQIQNARFEYPSPYWDCLSETPLALIDRMLTVDKEKRITVGECLRHPWITTEGPEPPELSEYTIAASGTVCNHIFRSGEIVYGCKDCAINTESILCRLCFKPSDHVDHMVFRSLTSTVDQLDSKRNTLSQLTSTTGQFCSCGDSSAWRNSLSCAMHVQSIGLI